MADLYKTLGVKENASESEIRSAYRRLALKYHPDKAGEESRADFENVSHAYTVLKDPKSRKRYDATGDDSEGTQSFEESMEVFKSDITVEDIEKFKASYAGSAEEREDVENTYREVGGDFGVLLEYALCSEIDDEARLKRIINEAIDAGRLKRKKAWDRTSNDKKARAARKRAARSEAREAEDAAAELGLNTDASEDARLEEIKGIIQKRNNSNFDALLERLSDKYAPRAKPASKKRRT